MAVATGLANQLGIWEGTTLALLEMTTKFTGAVRFGDTIRLEQKVASNGTSRRDGTSDRCASRGIRYNRGFVRV